VPVDGDGDGDGSGCGDGEGYGSGSGYGYGYGDGYGSGSSYGDGDGSGSGSGGGYGSGSGGGYGSKEYWAATIDAFAAKWIEPLKKRLSELRAEGHQIAFWRSGKDRRACNGGSNSPVEAGTIETIAGPLEICTQRALHATTIPPKWKGDRVWIVALKGKIQWSGDKCGALCREIIGECL